MQHVQTQLHTVEEVAVPGVMEHITGVWVYTLQLLTSALAVVVLAQDGEAKVRHMMVVVDTLNPTTTVTGTTVITP
jgi:hypothetical protein